MKNKNKVSFYSKLKKYLTIGLLCEYYEFAGKNRMSVRDQLISLGLKR